MTRHLLFGARSVRVALASTLAAAGAVVVGPTPAYAAFDVTPFGCAVALDAGAVYAVLGYDNPNPDPVTVELGSDNLVLQPPNLRPGQPSEFEPGRHEVAWTVSFRPNDPRANAIPWYLQGALATVDVHRWCAGAIPSAPAPVQLTTSGSSTEPLQVGDVIHVTAPERPGSMRRMAMEQCVADSCVPVRWPGADSWVDPSSYADYTVGPADAGHRLRLRFVTFDSSGWASVVSDPTAPVAGDAGAPPAGEELSGPPLTVVQPSVDGSPVVAEPLVADPGEWNGAAPLTVSGRWQRCPGDSPTADCAPIAGATDPTYRPTDDDLGSRLRWVSVASTTGVTSSVPGLPVVATAASAPTAPVAPAQPTPPDEPDEPTPPVTTPTAPRITGLRLQPSVFAVGGRTVPLGDRTGAHRKTHRGTTVVLRLSERAFVRLDVVGRGRTLTLTRWLPAGPSRLALSGVFPRSAGGRLKPGGYRLIVRARDDTGHLSNTARKGFRVVR